MTLTLRTAVLDLYGRSAESVSSPAKRHPRPDARERMVQCGEGDGSQVAILPGCVCSWCYIVGRVALRDFGVLVSW